jgi:hypothetical protein
VLNEDDGNPAQLRTQERSDTGQVEAVVYDHYIRTGDFLVDLFQGGESKNRKWKANPLFDEIPCRQTNRSRTACIRRWHACTRHPDNFFPDGRPLTVEMASDNLNTTTV